MVEMTNWLAVSGVAVVAILTWGFWWVEPAVKQPIEYPHKTHVEKLKIPCTGCHQRAEKDAVAGRPPRRSVLPATREERLRAEK